MSRAIILVRHTLSRAAKTNQQFSANFKPGIRTHASPFFGDPATAQIATIGVDPSWTEYRSARWASVQTPTQVARCLTSYFTAPLAQWHPYFQRWEVSLNHLGRSFTRDAVHIDLSPRPTIAMRNVPDPEAFERMLLGDSRWIILTLRLFPNIKAVLMAGSVSNRHYIDEFLARRALISSQFRLTPHSTLQPGRGGARIYRLHGHRIDVPVFFFGTSPSGSQWRRLEQTIKAQARALRSLGF